MISLKLSKKEAKKQNEPQTVGSSEEMQYPWGTSLSFEKDLIKKIKILGKLEAGDSVNIKATGFISEVSKTDSKEGGGFHSIRIQLEKISIDSESEAKRGFEED